MLKRRILKTFAYLLCCVTALFWAGCGGKKMEEEEERDVTVFSAAALHMRFNEEDGAEAKDSVGGRKHPIEYIFNEALYKRSVSAPRKRGIEKNALSFDGYSSAVKVGGFKMPNSEFTVSVWVAPRVYGTGKDGKLGIIANQQGGGKGFELGLDKFGALVFRVGTDGGGKTLKGGVVKKYEWTHIAAAFSGAEGRIALYVNGREVAKETFSPETFRAFDTDLLIGRHNESAMESGCYVNTFAGLMDEFVVLNKAVGKTDVGELLRQAGGTIPPVDFEDVWLDPQILADDRFKPQYHIYAPQHWMNEAIAPLYYNGKYHLFFQQTPNGPFWGYTHWGHFVSDDMVHWKNVRPALEPEDNGMDNDFVFSGSAILDKNGEPALFYTGVNMSADYYLNKISLARPRDLNDGNLLNWDKYGSSIVSQGSVGLPTDFRDPFIYRENGVYYMLVGTGTPAGNGSIQIYKAKDDSLADWEHLGECFTLPRAIYPNVGSTWELPGLAKLQSRNGAVSKYVFMMSPMSRDGGITQVYYWLGGFDASTGKFTPDRPAPALLDYGDHIVTCPVLFADPQSGKTLLFSSVGETWDATYRANAGYANGAATIREIELGDNGELIVKPYGQMTKLKDKPLADISNVSIAQANRTLESVKGDMLYIECEIENQGANILGLSVRRSPDEREETLVYYRYDEQALKIDTTAASLSNQRKGVSGGAAPLNGGNVKLKVFVDRSLIEAFANDRYSVTGRAYATLPDSMGVQLYAQGGGGKVVRMEVYSMKSIHGETVPAYYA